MELSLSALNSARAFTSAQAGFRMVRCDGQCGLSATKTAASTLSLSSRNTRRCQRPGQRLRRIRRPTRCRHENPHLSGVVLTANKAKRKGFGLVLRTIGAQKTKVSTFRTIGTVLCGMSTVTVPAVLNSLNSALLPCGSLPPIQCPSLNIKPSRQAWLSRI